MKRVYLIGICGTGMSALAGLFKEKGFDVGGSDKACYSPIKEEIENLNLKLYKNYSPKNILDFKPDFIIVGNIVGRGNPEGEFVLNRGYEFLSMPEALYEFFLKGKERIVVVGTHGKTTSASFLAYSFEEAGLHPGFFIGGIPVNLKKNYKKGKGQAFIVEGDEYETSFFDKYSKFFHYFPSLLILKPLEYDHIDIFSSEEEYLKAFRFLLREIPSEGKVFFPSSSANSMSLIPYSFSKNIIYGGKGEEDIYYILKNKAFPYVFEVIIGKESLGDFKLNLVGEYNIENILPAIYLLYERGIKPEKLREIVSGFKGVKRRQEILYNSSKIILIDDFAHHPTAIKKTIGSIKKSFSERRILAIFEPASWSLRKNNFQNELENSLKEADTIYLLDIKNREKIEKAKRLNLKKIKQSLEKKGKKVLIFEGKENKSYNVIGKLKDELKRYNWVIIILSNSTRLNLDKELKRFLEGKDL